MKVLYYDCFCGISGDMNLGALIDLGVDQEYLLKELSKLGLDDEYEIKITKDIKKGISGTKVNVILNNQNKTHNHHSHRNLEDIVKIINESNLHNNVKKLSLDIFLKLAQAEAKVHGKPVSQVYFHEVGAIDSIVDIVGAAIGLDYLKVDKIVASPVQVGGGFIKCAHGILPVPAPATVELLKNIPIKSGIVPFETTTPTGAAILAANVDEFTDKISFLIEKIGYGVGNRDLNIPNVLRVFLGNEEQYEAKEDQYILETNIDDMNPELYSYIEEKLFESGALDVYRTTILMKKGRSATKLSVLVNKEKEKAVQEVIFEETTSIGIRKYKVEKIMLQRDFTKINTQFGDVTVKNSYYQGKLIKKKPEYEDCKKIAKEKDLPIAKVYNVINEIINKQ
ncbi:nickel pincer cofactor biosynthesis protein LarC [Bacillota bacterium LX-D]|nr:nickel pincer cofactor biosynthesis protein LarC [Bacillota bacterium LX-D]